MAQPEQVEGTGSIMPASPVDIERQSVQVSGLRADIVRISRYLASMRTVKETESRSEHTRCLREYITDKMEAVRKHDREGGGI